jgi:probable HAF family extracellular repeat protein
LLRPFRVVYPERLAIARFMWALNQEREIMRRLPKARILLASMSASVSAALGAGPYVYSVKYLGTLDGMQSFPNSINESGMVVGNTYEGFTKHAMWYDGTTLQYIDGLENVDSQATGINALGEIVGTMQLSGSPRAFLYNDGVLQNLGPMNGMPTNATAINAAGVITGYATAGDGTQHPFLYSNGEFQDLTSLHISGLSAINESGEAAGNGLFPGVENPRLYSRAILYTSGQVYDLGTLGGTFSTAYGINDLGEVVGEAAIPGDSYSQAFLYNGDKMINLGTLPGVATSAAEDINNLGQIVGESGHGFIYSNGIMTDLNTLIDPSSGWIIMNARSINDQGEIAAYAVGQNVGFQAVLLTPVPEAAAVPVCAASLGILGFVGRRHGRYTSDVSRISRHCGNRKR